MRLAKLIATAGLMAATSIAIAQSADFEVKHGGSCGSHGPTPDDQMTLKRGWDRTVRVRIVFTSFCLLDEDFAPSVEYLDGIVRLRVQRRLDELTLHCSCMNKLTFTLKRPIPRGTRIFFGFGALEPHLSAIVP